MPPFPGTPLAVFNPHATGHTFHDAIDTLGTLYRASTDMTPLRSP